MQGRHGVRTRSWTSPPRTISSTVFGVRPFARPYSGRAHAFTGGGGRRAQDDGCSLSLSLSLSLSVFLSLSLSLFTHEQAAHPTPKPGIPNVVLGRNRCRRLVSPPDFLPTPKPQTPNPSNLNQADVPGHAPPFRFRVKGGPLKRFQGLSPESQDLNLALTVLHVPYALDRGHSWADSVESPAWGEKAGKTTSPQSGSNRQSLAFQWRSLESRNVWYISRRMKKTICPPLLSAGGR